MAVAYQVNPAHDGSMQGTALQLPLARKWSVDFGQAVSYPLIAGGKVFVTVSDGSSYGTRLYALDEATGSTAWGPIELGGTYFWSGTAYDDGKLFAVNYDGIVRAFDAGTGQTLWQGQPIPSQHAFSSPPTALQGVLYVGGAGSGGTLAALDETTGEVLWSQPVANGDHSSPAISEDGVFVSYACAQSYKFDRSTGALLWQAYNGCAGGGGKTPVYYNQRLYVRDSVLSTEYVYDSESGAQTGSFEAGPAPAFANGLGYYLYQGTLRATDLSTGSVVWSFAGDGTLSSAPLVAGSVVYVGGGSGNVYGLDAASGQQLWSDRLAAGIPAPDEQNVSQPLTGLNAGEGLMVVPAGNLLVAYGGQ